MTDAERIAKLELPAPDACPRVVLDTDTYNEVDDQFAVAYAVRSAQAGQLRLEGIYAAPFVNTFYPTAAEGMEMSYQEILKVMERLHYPKGKALARRGSDRKLTETDGAPCDSPAARDLINRAMNSDETLYVVAIGAGTNIASALLLEPLIKEKIVLIWLAGNAPHWPHIREYNVCQDLRAAQIIFNSGVPLILMPAYNVVSHMLTTTYEIDHFLAGKSEIGSYLAGIVHEYASRAAENAEPGYAWSKVIWDVVGIAVLLCPDAVQTSLTHTPILTDDLHWASDSSRPLMRVGEYVRRDPIFTDVFRKLAL